MKYVLEAQVPRYRMSLPSRERGLKFIFFIINLIRIIVAPFTGAWIEIQAMMQELSQKPVAPFTGAWIEIVSGL